MLALCQLQTEFRGEYRHLKPNKAKYYNKIITQAKVKAPVLKQELVCMYQISSVGIKVKHGDMLHKPGAVGLILDISPC